MENPEQIKELVREKYAAIAIQDPDYNAASCCGVDGCATIDYSIFSEDYTDLEGYVKSADLKLGCGMPVEYAGISKGATVLDLGSGAGNDVFIARALTGKTGEVIGVDMTPKMIEIARKNAQDLKLENVKFRQGEIEDLPLAGDRVDVVISNCVLNLVPDKGQAYREVHRVLKPGGHFAISDVVIKGDLPESLRKAGEMYAGCVAGALQKHEYMGVIHDAGFQNVSIRTEKEIILPDEVLSNYLDADGIQQFRSEGIGIYSITVTGDKTTEACCTPSSGCC